MSAFIPDQLHHMSNKELIEFAQTAHEENVKLVQQLAKANERVKELEAQQQLLVNEIEPLLDMQDGGEYYTRNSLADDIYEKFIGGSSAEALNKFALEKKIEGMQRVLDCRELNLSEGEVDTIKLMQEQLRKEQE